MTDEDIKNAVEEIYSLEFDADISRDEGDDVAVSSLHRQSEKLQNKLETVGITLEEDEENVDIVHVMKDGQHWLDFEFNSDWQWHDITPVDYLAANSSEEVNRRRGRKKGAQI